MKEILFAIIEETVTEIGADRGTLFLNDPLTGELYSRVAQGELTREIRILNTSGIAGAIFIQEKVKLSTMFNLIKNLSTNKQATEQKYYMCTNKNC